MTQTFELFKGAPEDLVIKLNALKAGGATIHSVTLTTSSAVYLIIHEA